MAAISLDHPDDTRFMSALSEDVARARIENYRAEHARLDAEARLAEETRQAEPTAPTPMQSAHPQPVPKQVEPKQKPAPVPMQRAEPDPSPKAKKQKPIAVKKTAPKPKATVINTAAYGDQAEIDSCIGAANVTVSSRYYGVPYLAQHTSCGGGRILALS